MDKSTGDNLAKENTFVLIANKLYSLEQKLKYVQENFFLNIHFKNNDKNIFTMFDYSGIQCPMFDCGGIQNNVQKNTILWYSISMSS